MPSEWPMQPLIVDSKPTKATPNPDDMRRALAEIDEADRLWKAACVGSLDLVVAAQNYHQAVMDFDEELIAASRAWLAEQDRKEASE